MHDEHFVFVFLVFEFVAGPTGEEDAVADFHLERRAEAYRTSAGLVLPVGFKIGSGQKV